ncbi:hypothetical protein HK104_007840 [Borealophlyctis nickersoniae]|nr:hypothetical protein HK104_007840 [Borealophlyctis nickersoniae]
MTDQATEYPTGDLLLLEQLVNASGVHLDDRNSLSNDSESYRYSGITINVVLEYSGSNVGNPSDITYKIVPTAAINQPASAVEIHAYNSTTGQYVIYERHGINLVFTQAGAITRTFFLGIMAHFAGAAFLAHVVHTVLLWMLLIFSKNRQRYLR